MKHIHHLDMDLDGTGSIVCMDCNFRISKQLAVTAPELLEKLKMALDILTDIGITLEGDEEAFVAGVRLEIHETVVKAEGGAK